ncbi:MAG TPA: MoaD/ThiS family protein [Casimicrobiaceae bacterium]|nr:MoaD/ThiS family protein [Casimicrobiaceae bacterium]
MPDSGKPTLTVRMVYLARLREAFGHSGESLAFTAPGRITVSSLLARLRERGAPWATELAAGRAVRVAVNHAIATDDTPVRDGDEVALFPPVTGG